MSTVLVLQRKSVPKTQSTTVKSTLLDTGLFLLHTTQYSLLLLVTLRKLPVVASSSVVELLCFTEGLYAVECSNSGHRIRCRVLSSNGSVVSLGLSVVGTGKEDSPHIPISQTGCQQWHQMFLWRLGMRSNIAKPCWFCCCCQVACCWSWCCHQVARCQFWCCFRVAHCWSHCCLQATTTKQGRNLWALQEAVETALLLTMTEELLVCFSCRPMGMSSVRLFA